MCGAHHSLAGEHVGSGGSGLKASQTTNFTNEFLACSRSVGDVNKFTSKAQTVDSNGPGSHCRGYDPSSLLT